ncbi:hypothetical protein HDU76_006460, partial [Blyttiomyces sp. JEL0837]
ANDTGALKTAHVGLALSDAEASIVAPFTSGKRLVSDVPKLIAEGRCALDTSFMAFKYMFMYPIVQLAMTATLNQVGSGLSNNQFLFDDMAIVLVLAILMLQTPPVRRMGSSRPTDNLFSHVVTLSILGHFVICVGMFAINFVALTEQDWYCSSFKARSGVNITTWEPRDPNAPYNVSYPCYFIYPETDTVQTTLIKTQENTAVWLFGHFQFAILSLAISCASPHRRPLYTNLSFVAYLLGSLTVLTLMLLWDDEEVGFDQLQLLFSIREGVSWDYRVASLTMVITTLVLCVIWEAAIVNRVIRTWVLKLEASEEERKERRLSRRAGCDVTELLITTPLNGIGPGKELGRVSTASRDSISGGNQGGAFTNWWFSRTGSMAADIPSPEVTSGSTASSVPGNASSSVPPGSSSGSRWFLTTGLLAMSPNTIAQRLGPRLNMAAAMRVARSWTDLSEDEERGSVNGSGRVDGSNNDLLGGNAGGGFTGYGSVSGWRRRGSPFMMEGEVGSARRSRADPDEDLDGDGEFGSGHEVGAGVGVGGGTGGGPRDYWNRERPV